MFGFLALPRSPGHLAFVPKVVRLLLVNLLIVAVGVGAVFVIYGTPEQRMRSAFLDAGLSEPLAGCMAERLAERLTYRQMWRLGGLAAFRDEGIKEMNLADIVEATRGLRDREVLAIAARSAAACGLAHGRPRLSITV